MDESKVPSKQRLRRLTVLIKKKKTNDNQLFTKIRYILPNKLNDYLLDT